MKRKLLAILLSLVMLACAVPVVVTAEIEPPSSLGAPEHFGVGHYYNDSVYFTFSSPEDLRTYIDKWTKDDPDHTNFLVNFQVDYKIDNGSWHHTSDWDSPKTVPDGIDDMYFVFQSEKHYNNGDRWSLSSLFPDDEKLKAFAESGWDYLKSHSITFRIRFAHSFDYDETFTLSPWSKEYTLSANAKADYNKLINHAPTVLSAEVKLKEDGEPYFEVKLGKVPGEVQDLNAMSSNTLRTEIWMRKAGDEDFKYIHYEWCTWEYLEIAATDYLGNLTQSYDEAGFEIKTRYALDLREYKQAGYFETATTNVDIYSPFSNVISHNMPAWSKASAWATTELAKANEAGLIPDILQGADMTGPITREEFAELAVKLYEQTTGKAATPASPNPFKDTTNPQILKAYKLGITTGTSATTFAPKELTNREQVATMLSRAVRTMAPGGDFSTAGAPSFSDKKDISAWALDHVLFMAKLGIIKGSGDKFMPKATTTAQTAAGYATTTREQAIAMSVRSFEKLKSGDLGALGDNTSTNPTQPGKTDDSIVGTWTLGTLSGGRFNAASGQYEGGVTGLGQQYTFKPDGTYYALAIWSNAIYFTGKYSVKDGVLKLTERVVEESNDNGKTWGVKETLPDTMAHFTTGSDDTGKYLLIGEEGATPPLVEKINALKYKFTAASGTEP